MVLAVNRCRTTLADDADDDDSCRGMDPLWQFGMQLSEMFLAGTFRSRLPSCRATQRLTAFHSRPPTWGAWWDCMPSR